jgi:hypothetical protein
MGLYRMERPYATPPLNTIAVDSVFSFIGSCL